MNTKMQTTNKTSSVTETVAARTKSVSENQSYKAVISEVSLGTIKGLDENGYPLIHWPESLTKKPVKARSQIKVTELDIDRECTISFVNGDYGLPIVMGLLYEPDLENAAPTIIQSDDAIVLQSGSARIELHANGRIHLQGLHITSQAYGPNQLKGASVKIN